jgi:hypothetical protein
VAEVRKCSCGEGNQQVLDTLRSTTLAEMPVDEFNEIVDDVNKAGGIRNLSGLSRVLIEKALNDLRAGVEKGDYEGHPFRGNQWTDSSGTGRGGAGGGPKGSKNQRARYFDSAPDRPQTAGARYFDSAPDRPQAAGAKYIDMKGNSPRRAESVQQELNRLSREGLQSQIDELKMYIDDHKGMAEVLRDLGNEDGARQAEANAAKAEKEVRGLKAEIDRRQKRFEMDQKTESAKTKVTEDNIDSKLKGDDLKQFKAQVKEAETAVKEFRKTVADIQKRVAAEGVRGVASILKEALNEARTFEKLVRDAKAAPTIRQAVRMTSLGTNAGENAKGALREVLGKLKGGESDADTEAINALQTAGDKYFGLSPDRYNLDDAFDFIDS